MQAVTKDKGDERASGGHRQIPPVPEGGRRQVVQQDVADDAPAQRSDHAEGDDTDDVQPDSAHGSQRSVKAERDVPARSRASSKAASALTSSPSRGGG